MAKPLVSDELWKVVEPLLPSTGSGAAGAADRLCRIVPCSPAFCSYSRPAFPGRLCPWKWDAGRA